MAEFEHFGEERREFERRKVKVEISFDKGGQIVETASTRDIGLGGLYITTDVEAKVGEVLSVAIEFPEGRFEAAGSIVYVDKGQGFGVRFQNLSQESEKILRKALGLR